MNTFILETVEKFYEESDGENILENGNDIKEDVSFCLEIFNRNLIII